MLKEGERKLRLSGSEKEMVRGLWDLEPTVLTKERVLFVVVDMELAEQYVKPSLLQCL